MKITSRFDLDIPALARSIGQEPSLIQRKIALEAYSELVARTPKDTGRAQTGWSVDTRHGDYVPKAGEKTYVPAPVSIPKNSDLIVLYNNVEYIINLNEGTSTQAPAMFVETAIDRVMGAF